MSADEERIPLVDLRASIAPIRDEVLAAFGEILDGMQLFLGANVQAFEREFADYCGAGGAVGVSSGTDAVYAALRAVGVGPGDEVIVPSHTFFATIEAIVHAGATPVMVDVEPDTLTLDPQAVEDALSPRTRAILPVHLYGMPVAMDPLQQIARARELSIVEDASQAHGARYRGTRCGALGDAAAFSFYLTKNLGALGEAGAVTAREESVLEQVRLLRHHGHRTKFDHALVGHNLRIDELQAAVLRIKLRGLDAAVERRRDLARRYDAHFAGSDVATLRPRADDLPAYHLYPVRVPDRDGLADWLGARGIDTGIHYRVPAHQQPALEAHPHRRGPMPVTEAACESLLSLPLYPELRDDQVDRVAGQVLAYHGSRAKAQSSA